MSLYDKKNILFKRLLAVFLTGILVSTTGCSNREEPKNDEKINEKNQKETPKEKDQFAYVTKDVMTAEETNALDENQFIKAEDLKKIPDAKTLEDRDLAFIYCYDYTAVPVGEVAERYISVGYEKPVAENKMHIVQEEPGQGVWKVDHIFTGIKILPIINYLPNGDGTWEKLVTYGVYGIEAGPVLNKDKIKELEGSE